MIYFVFYNVTHQKKYHEFFFLDTQYTFDSKIYLVLRHRGNRGLKVNPGRNNYY